MEILIGIGAALALGGIAGLIACIVMVARARKSGDEAHLRATLQRVVAINLAALLVSILGLGVVVMGVILS